MSSDKITLEMNQALHFLAKRANPHLEYLGSRHWADYADDSELIGCGPSDNIYVDTYCCRICSGLFDDASSYQHAVQHLKEHNLLHFM